MALFYSLYIIICALIVSDDAFDPELEERFNHWNQRISNFVTRSYEYNDLLGDFKGKTADDSDYDSVAEAIQKSLYLWMDEFESLYTDTMNFLEFCDPVINDLDSLWKKYCGDSPRGYGDPSVFEEGGIRIESREVSSPYFLSDFFRHIFFSDSEIV